MLDPGSHRRGARLGLQARAGVKLAEVEAKIADLAVIRDTLRAAIIAGCDDLFACSHPPSCPLSFDELSSVLGALLDDLF